MKLTAEQMEKLIRAERRDAIKALNDAEKALMQLAIDILPDIPEKETLRKATTHWKYREQILDLILKLDA